MEDLVYQATPETLANLDDSGAFLKRMQLNVSKVTDIDPEAMCECLPKNKEYIIQIGREEGKGLTLARTLQDFGHKVSVLFDTSGGKGRTSKSWPNFVSDLKCGFAGGLGPVNLQDQLSRLVDLVGVKSIWIDMESKVRTSSNLDLLKVSRYLIISHEPQQSKS